MQGFEWDSNKEERNIRDRGLDFTIASRIWEGPILERVDARHDYGETRIMAFGKVDGRLMAVLFTWRGSNRRIISARKANRREQRRFEAEIGENDGPVTN
ncbi:MAG: BrnT family toxin [Stellaceae bacterium]